MRPELIKRYEQGPFPGQVDPWAEATRYFQSIHSSMIEHIIGQIRDPLLAMGYVVGKETSSQITAGREPDIFVQQANKDLSRLPEWDYALAAAEVLAEPGILVQDESELESIRISDLETGQLVTVVEIISPGNKTRDTEIINYQARRTRLVREKGVHVVEIDLTRSVKRLLMNSLTQSYAYHVAIFIVGEQARVVGMGVLSPLVRIALPLRGEVAPIALQMAYDHAYRLVNVAWHIEHETRYSETNLPFASRLTDVQRQHVLQTVNQWQKRVAQLKALH